MMKTGKNNRRQRTTDNTDRTNATAFRLSVCHLCSVVNAFRLPQSFLLALSSLTLAVFLFSAAFAVDGDIVFKREGGAGGIAPTVFPHWFHRIRYKCYACHPALFEMKAGANKITMELIQQGKFCGACHNGKIAWSVTFETCNRCHAEK